MVIKKGFVGLLLIIGALLSMSFMDNEDYEARLQASKDRDETIYISSDEIKFLTSDEVKEIAGLGINNDCLSCPRISSR